MNNVLFQSNSDEWRTPLSFFQRINQLFFFQYDAASTLDNSLCPYRLNDGLAELWPNLTFCNPPYSQIKNWAEHACKSALQPNKPLIAMLIPTRTDTTYWHKWIFKHASHILFIKGRLKFSNTKNSAPFPSALILFNAETYYQKIKDLENLGYIYTLQNSTNLHDCANYSK